MLSKKDKSIIVRFARRYNISAIILFGSVLKDGIKSSDIDIGVLGIKPHLFFKFYGELLRDLKKPIHLVDLSIRNRFSRLVMREGIKIYG